MALIHFIFMCLTTYLIGGIIHATRGTGKKPGHEKGGEPTGCTITPPQNTGHIAFITTLENEDENGGILWSVETTKKNEN
jgi:hypothetical protein